MGKKNKYRSKYSDRNRCKGIQWYWWLLGFGAYLVFMILEFRPELQPMRDTILWKVTGKAIYSGLILYFAWIAKKHPPRSGQIIMTLMAATFWLGLIVPSNRLVLLYITVLVFAGIGYLFFLVIQKKKNNEPLMYATMFFAIMLLDFMRDYTYVDGDDTRHWQISLVLALIVGVAACYLIFYGFIRLKDDRMSEKVCWCIISVVVAFILFWTTVNNLNYMLDFSLPDQYQMTITDKEINSSKSGTYYELTLVYKKEKFDLNVPQSTYFQYEIGDRFPVELYRGFFGDPYYIAE